MFNSRHTPAMRAAERDRSDLDFIVLLIKLLWQIASKTAFIQCISLSNDVDSADATNI
jgi:hypothetical protein